MNIVNGFDVYANNWLNVSLLIIACLRIYLEVIEFKFESLPITKGMMNSEQAIRFHRTGFYFCVGYVVLFAPSTLFS